MIISKTPYRISLFGGSTDYQSYFELYGSLLIGFTINKYCYIAMRPTPSIIPYHSKISYSESETVERNEDIRHNGVRGTLEYMDIDEGIELLHMGDLPAQTGTGSSSSFVVGLLRCIDYWKKRDMSRREIANAAIMVERHLLQEAGGIQDQIWAAYGGFNSIHVQPDGYFEVRPLPVSRELKQKLRRQSFLLYTGKTRKSFEIAQSHDNTNAEQHKGEIHQIAQDAYSCFAGSDLNCIGDLLHQSWTNKKKISPLVCPPEVSELYSDLQGYGMIGGKLLGTGGSGFIFGITSNENQAWDIRRRYEKQVVDWDFDKAGSQIINNGVNS